MTDIEALREAEQWLEELRHYRIAADDSAQSDALVDATLLAVRGKRARLAAPAPDVEAVAAVIEALSDLRFDLEGRDGLSAHQIDGVLSVIRPCLRPALTEEQVREALHEPDGMRLFDEECDGWVVDALHRAGLLVTP